MADKITPEQRSKNMSAVKIKNTHPEMLVRKFLYKNGLRYRVNFKSLPGKPDIAITKNKLAIFIHRCFWHSHPCSKGKLPKINKKFWKDKIFANQKRDLKNTKLLKDLEWKTICIWEYKINKLKLNQFTKQNIPKELD